MDDWDSLLNPYEENLKQGQREGEESGLRAGYNDGWNLGKVKAIEIGVELGYMHSIASNGLRDICRGGQDKDGSIQQERRIKKISDFIKAVESFPSADVIFSTPTTLARNNETIENEENGDDSERGSGTVNTVDIVDQMQRIRAKFKTILVQMKRPNLTLKKVMNNHNPTSVTPQEGPTSMKLPGVAKISTAASESQPNENEISVNHQKIQPDSDVSYKW